MLATGDLKGDAADVREDDDRVVVVPELTMHEAMQGGKWKLLAWLENRGATDRGRSS
jgi:hypothetical protein